MYHGLGKRPHPRFNRLARFNNPCNNLKRSKCPQHNKVLRCPCYPKFKCPCYPKFEFSYGSSSSSSSSRSLYEDDIEWTPPKFSFEGCPKRCPCRCHKKKCKFSESYKKYSPKSRSFSSHGRSRQHRRKRRCPKKKFKRLNRHRRSRGYYL